MDFIYKEEAISKTDCENLINYFEENINLAKKGSAGVKNLNNLEINIKLNKPSDFNNLGKTLDNALLNYVKNFPLFKKLHPFRLYRSFQLCRFLPGNHYSNIHCENDGNSKYLNRVLAWMVYLNDIKNGGGTEFIHQNITLTPKAGNLYIWPAGPTHMHKGVVALNEKKYFLTGWYVFS